MSDSYFINPYNFVPLEGKCDKQERRNGEFTGVIECNLQTLTPTFIPNNIETSQEFFHYPQDKQPIIPGSEIRGMIRSVFEAAFNGCLSQVNKGAFHRRSMEKKQAGLLYKKDGVWKLQEADPVKLKEKPYLTKSKKLQEAQLLYSKNNKLFYDIQENIDYKEGYVHLSEQGIHGKPIFVFQPKDKVYDLEEKDINSLITVLEIYQKNRNSEESKGKFRDHSGYVEYKNILMGLRDNKAEGIMKLPVYYVITSNKVSHLAPAVLSQEVFENTLLSILKHQGDYEPCTCQSKICAACHLFGFVSEQFMQASRIRFSDAVPREGVESFEEIIRLPALGEPKPGTIEFYAEKIVGAKYWTYDYKTNQVEETLDSIAPNDIKLNGRKFYWHHKPNTEKYKEDAKKTKKSKMEYDVKPIKGNGSFTFNIYFEKLSEQEINQLCNVLDINSSKKHAHKIGRGKPLGFGSVCIEVNSIKVRTIDGATGLYSYTEKSRVDNKLYNIHEHSDLLQILACEPNLPKGAISYPKVAPKKSNGKPNDIASHQWFNKNNKNKKEIKRTLPTIKEETSNNKYLWLKILEK
ncbi:TIGR03986 family type III CRISPR-associated RAMP protein [Bacillus ndiopicus]|uniref:TIGR03986 family type III CRISPR-associated RAMP protein n=1 Tax=Bacillus ndiopicus TaxID=1347368 RepID=UPI0005A8A4E0|nr:TIGR03986 family CRISPR-associated RAMP protein [Bacillus ndiopicus]